jgi:hypothetical protein
MPVFSYWAYGLRIDADIACPELRPAPPNCDEADVSIHLLPALSEIQDISEAIYYQIRPGLFRLTVKDVGLYRVEEGKRLFIEPLKGVPIDRLRLFLLGSCMGALLYQRGLFPLHGSAVETPWGAMIFVGAQGAGKSTLAAEFHRCGFRLLSDDVCAVQARDNTLEVLPALTQIRLCDDAYHRLGTPANAGFNVDKFVLPLGKGYCPHPVLLRAIHVLEEQNEETPRFHPLCGLDRIRRLLGNLYRSQYLIGQKTQSDLFRLAGQIAQKAEVVSVFRRRDVNAIRNLVTFLESTWAERYTQISVQEKF